MAQENEIIMGSLMDLQRLVVKLSKERGVNINTRVHHDYEYPRIVDLSDKEYPEHEKSIKQWLHFLQKGPS